MPLPRGHHGPDLRLVKFPSTWFTKPSDAQLAFHLQTAPPEYFLTLSVSEPNLSASCRK